MKIVGVTGSFGSGKSLVGRMFAEKGAQILNADKIAHDVLNGNKTCFSKIVKKFGKDVAAKGKIDRQKLADIVFSDDKKLRMLEGIIHPYVIKEIKAKVRSYEKTGKYEVLVLDVPLLFESGLDSVCDIIIVVKANQAEQIARLKKKFGYSRSEVLKRIKLQMPIKEKVVLADVVVDNRGTLGNTRKQINHIWNNVLFS